MSPADRILPSALQAPDATVGADPDGNRFDQRLTVPADGAWHDVSVPVTPVRLGGNMVLT